ncbi:nicotinate phosphoribosyltransferase isoform X1 [Mobula birostris]|uniref:nicotinate phosphoribosyltransferase isoform X1 n=1 Tax=Mobula birostris TaxID=1983395 RepID=UPI003B286F53
MFLKRSVQPLLTDFYQFTMAYGYWKSGRQGERAVFELCFRKNPLGGEFTIFAGLQDCLSFLSEFQLSREDVQFLRSVLPPATEEGFFNYLLSISTREVAVRAVPEGSIVFPQVALLEVEGPLAIVQILETPLLTLVNYASLVATNAARFRIAAGPDRRLLELGLRRAQGPDGGISASRYSYIGGFDGTSNVLAGKLYGIPLFGSVAHSYITSFTSMSEVKVQGLGSACGSTPALDFASLCRDWLSRVCEVLEVPKRQVNLSELAAFASFASSSPRNFAAVVDTYNVTRSGVPNFCAVALALQQLGYRALGLRLDSGDLLQQSLVVRRMLQACADRFGVPWLSEMQIIVTNSISEKDLMDLQQQPNAVDSVGVGTHLVTCPVQPSLGCVYKLTQVNSKPRMKLTEDEDKMTLPGKKTAYRFFRADGSPFLDLLMLASEPVPEAGEEVWCHVLRPGGGAVPVTATRVELLHHVYYERGQMSRDAPSMTEIRSYAQDSLSKLPAQHKCLVEPVPYQVAISMELHRLLSELAQERAPVPEESHCAE